MEQFERTKSLIGENALEKLKEARVAIFGIGGVGGYAVEALVRAGVGEIDLIDNDKVGLSNLNRQIIALESTLDMLKVDVVKERILAINPNCEVNVYPLFITEENIDEINYDGINYIVDAVDTIVAKIAIIKKAKELNIPIISSMGAGNRLDPFQIRVADINQTKNCPLAKTMRYELKRREIKNVKCVYSLELPVELTQKIINPENNKTVIGSISYMPSMFGLIIASEIIKDI